jgi:WD40 repeat protein
MTGERCGPGRVPRLLKPLRLQAIQPRSFRPRTTQSRHPFGYSANLLSKAPPPYGINQVWLGAITFVPLAGSIAASPSRFCRLPRHWIPSSCSGLRIRDGPRVADDVRRFLEHKPIRAKRPTLLQRLSKWCRRNPLLAGALTAVAVAAVLGTVVAWLLASWALTEAERARREAYTAKMRLMQPAWETHNIAQLHQLLDETAAFPERGFEWYYWQRLCHVEHLTLVGHIGGVTAVAFAPDGQHLATSGKDGTARIWHARSGQELFCLRGHRSEVTSVAFEPGGQWLVTGSTDGTAKLWDVASGRELRTLQGPNTGSVWAVAATPNGQRIVTGSADERAPVAPEGTVRIWDAVSRQQLQELRVDLVIRSLAVTLDGQRLAVGGWGQASLWDIARGDKLHAYEGPRRRVDAIALAPDARWLITGSDDGLATAWDTASGRELFSLNGHTDTITSIAVTLDGRRIVTGSVDGTVRLWDAVSGQELLTLNGHTGGITAARSSPFRRTITGRCSDATRLSTSGKHRSLARFVHMPRLGVERLYGHDPILRISISLDCTAPLRERKGGPN